MLTLRTHGAYLRHAVTPRIPEIIAMNDIKYAPGPELYLCVRAGFVTQGTSLTSWCKQRGVNASNARAALAGAWNGPKGKRLRKDLLEASGVVVS